MKPAELRQLQMEVETLKQQVCHTLDTILARIEQHMPIADNERRYQEIKNTDWANFHEDNYP